MTTQAVVMATWKFGRTAVERAVEALGRGASALEATVAGATAVEDDPAVNSVGYGGLPDACGTVSLDACVMDGATLDCGAVAALTGIRHAGRVAHLVMTTTPHVMLAGEAARRFAIARGLREENLLTPQALTEWQTRAARAGRAAGGNAPRVGDAAWHQSASSDGWPTHDTVTVLCRDVHGHLGGCCTTSGLAHKLPGRVGDSPLIGAGLYVDDTAGAAGATGVGEEAIRISAAAVMVEAMRAGQTAQAATELAVRRIVQTAARRATHPLPAVAFIALTPDGQTGAACTAGTNFGYALWRGWPGQQPPPDDSAVVFHRSIEITV